MKGFQLIKDGVAITMNKVDESAANFWNKQVHDKRYCCPYQKKEAPAELSEGEKFRFNMKEETNEAISASWFDVIGRAIMEQGYYSEMNSWKNVIHTMCCESIGQTILGRDMELPDIKSKGDSIECDDKIIINLYVIVNYFKPYVELIKHWEKLGWKPRKVEE